MSIVTHRICRLGAGIVLGLTASMLAACGSPGGSSGGGDGDISGQIVFAGFGGTLGEAERKAWFDEFEKEHPGVEIVYDDGVNFAKLKAMTETGNATWDVYTGDLYAPDPSPYFEKLDCSIIPCGEIMEDTNVSDHMTVYYTYSDVITYDASKLSTGPTDWAEVFDTERFPGKRTFGKSAGQEISTLMVALLADGVPADELFPLDYDRAFKKLDTIKDDIVWYDTLAQCPQLIRDGEATVGKCLVGRVKAAQDDGADLEVDWNQNISGGGAIGVVKGSPNEKAAQALVAFILDKQHNAKMSKHYPNGPTNENAFDKVDPDMAPFLLSSHQDVETVPYDWNWARENGDELTRRFNEWLQS